MEHKEVVVIGSTGSGKSSFFNTLCGKHLEFKVSANKQSETF
jgi:GTP-binding protein EngB required for normal cell division